MAFPIVAGSEVDEIPFLFRGGWINRARVHDRDVQHASLVEEFLRVDEIAFGASVSPAVSPDSQRGDMYTEGSVLEEIENGLPTRTVIDEEIGISITIQIGLDVVGVVEQHTQNTIAVVGGAPLFVEVPEFHLVRHSLVHQVCAERINVESPVVPLVE